jgi:cephalosporin-C deacetylase-like acetyl esterase
MDYEKLRNEISQFIQITIKKTVPYYDVIDSIEYEEYTESLISYKGTEDSVIRAYLLTPKIKINGQGILVHHQHNGERNYGKSEVVGKVGDVNQHLGLVLVKKGFTILAPDSICFEDRRTNASGTNIDENDFIQHYCEMNKRILKGESLMKKVVEESSISLSLLIHLQNINPKKIGILGHSYGGITALYHGALDDRIQYICTSGALASFSRKLKNITGIEMASIIPGFMQKYETIDLLKATQPRNVLVLSATEDPYSIDADEIYNDFINEVENKNTVQHIRFIGGHPLTSERVDKIVQWFEMK